MQEAYALGQILKMFCDDRQAQVAGSTLVIDVDNMTLFHAFTRGRAKDTHMHGIIFELFWLQIRADFTLKVRWVNSKTNAEADELPRPETGENVRLASVKFTELWEWLTKGFDMDLMATPTTAHQIPEPYTGVTDRLPFYSRYRTEGCAGVDVFSQVVSHIPGAED